MTTEGRLARLEMTAALHQQRLETIEEDIRELGGAIKSLRNAIITFAFTVAGSAIAILLAITQVAV